LHSDAAIENALRDTIVELDKDTKGVAGSPPIAETILRKVEECAVFVADLTFVGQSKDKLVDSSEKPRQFPNPNVLIEYGYALRCHSHAGLVGIMNTAYGKPDAESLPFDLRHLRWPITYHLTNPSGADRGNQFKKLVATLVEAIGLILSEHSTSPIAVEKFVPQKATKDAASFWPDGTTVSPESQREPESLFGVPEGAKAYLRVYPTLAVPPIESELEAKNLARKGYLQPMGEVRGWGVERNVFGSIAYETPRDKTLYRFTQLFLSREIWGVDARVLNANQQRDMWQYSGYSDGRNYIPSEYIETQFVSALKKYLIFARAHLQIRQPLRIEAGLVGIRGYGIEIEDGSTVRGNALHDVVRWQGEASEETAAWDVLLAFFNKIWANSGVVRGPERQAKLANQFKNAS
jgi:hypothetical protein